MSGFRTLPVATTQSAIYTLSIRAPGQSYGEILSYNFPLSPASIKYQTNALSNYYETRGPSATQGVTRVIDSYGLSPPIIEIAGTTGFDLHSTDGFSLTGLQSIQALSQFLDTYAELNAAQTEAGNPQLYTLEFYDYYTGSFYQIEPTGPQIIRQSNDRPLLVYYQFRWAAVQEIATAIPSPVDILVNTFDTPAAQAIITTTNVLSVFFTAYDITGQA